MKKWVFLIIIILCFSEIYAQSDEDKLKDALSTTMEKYTKKTTPFPIIGKWSLLIPNNGNISLLPKNLTRYEDIFKVIKFEIIDDANAKVLLDKKFGWAGCSWQHASIGTKFYLKLDNTYTIKIIYYMNIQYKDKDESKNVWDSIHNAFINGDNEYQISILSYQLMMKNNNDEIIDKNIKILETRRKVSSMSTIPVLIGILENGNEISSSQAVITRLSIL